MNGHVKTGEEEGVGKEDFRMTGNELRGSAEQYVLGCWCHGITTAGETILFRLLDVVHGIGRTVSNRPRYREPGACQNFRNDGRTYDCILRPPLLTYKCAVIYARWRQQKRPGGRRSLVGFGRGGIEMSYFQRGSL